MGEPRSVALALEDGVAVMSVERPHVMNAFDWPAMDAFAAAVARLTDLAAAGPQSALRAVVVTGAGERAFSSGGDLRALGAARSRRDAERLAGVMGDALVALEDLPVPVLAAVNGHAVGGGAEIALACDLRLVDRAVQLGLVHLRLAETPGWGGGARLVRLVGQSQAAGMLLSARTCGADELLAMGLANGVAPRGQALALALSFAREVAARDPAAVRAVKRLLIAARAGDFPKALAAERASFVDLWPAPAHIAAMDAFLAGDDDPA